MRPSKIALLSRVAASVILAAWAGTARAGDYQVEIPKSRLELPPQHVMSKPAVPDSVSFGVSSWMPGSFSLPSQIQTTNSFQGAGLPSFYGDYHMPVSRFPELSVSIGGSWTAMNRNGIIDGTGVQVQQSIYVLSLRAGAEYSPEKLRFYTLLPYASVSLLPSFAVAGQTAFDNGTVYFGIPVELAIGARMPVKTIGLPWNGIDLELALNQTFGTIDHSSVAGFGVSGGMRIGL